MIERAERPGGWLYHSGLEVTHPLDLVTDLGGDPPLSVHMVFTLDGAYVPAVVRKPSGRGPFPAVMCLHGGSGGLGVTFLTDQMRNRGWLFDRLVGEGYLVCLTEGRAEREDAYGTDFPAVLDHHDVVEVFGYLQRSSEVDAGRIGTFGVSHGGELQMKLISEIGQGPAAMIPTEPAVIEYLGLEHEGGSDEGWAVADSSGPRLEERLQFPELVGDDRIDLTRANERVERISDGVPIMVVGRDADHLQGLFQKVHELLTRAGKRSEWASFDHPEHAYQWGPRRTSAGYAPDAIQRQTADHIVAFLNRHVRDRAARRVVVESE